ncbi:transposase [Rhodovulum sulfidophilum]|nr:transposase [Rhodovulum sulfidophilum]
MSEIVTVGLDLSQDLFQVHGADGEGNAVLRKKLGRAQVLEFFASLSPCLVAMEAWCGVHFRWRKLATLGHDICLIPPAHVKPFIKRQKNDAADAEAICEAVHRPNLRFVPVKSEETQGVGLPPSGGPISVLVHDGSLSYGWGGRRYGPEARRPVGRSPVP